MILEVMQKCKNKWMKLLSAQEVLCYGTMLVGFHRPGEDVKSTEQKKQPLNIWEN